MRQTLLALLGSIAMIFVACSSENAGNNELSEELAETVNGAQVHRFGTAELSEWVIVYDQGTAQKVMYNGILVTPESAVPQSFTSNTFQQPRLVAGHQPSGPLIGSGTARQVAEFNLDNGQTRLEVNLNGVNIKIIGDKIQMGGGGGGGGGFDDFGGKAGGGGDFGGGSGW